MFLARVAIMLFTKFPSYSQDASCAGAGKVSPLGRSCNHQRMAHFHKLKRLSGTRLASPSPL